MSDFAFNDYCLTCNQQCHFNQVYCGEECKNIDESYSDDNLSDYSPLITPQLQTAKINENIDEFEYFDLNSKKIDFLEILPTTSCNYRKWISST